MTPTTFARPLLVLFVAVSLVGGVTGGLLRAGVTWADLSSATVFGHAAVAHAALLMSGFLGTVIAIERAVAIRLRWAFAAPLAAGLGGALLLTGRTGAAAWVGVVAALVFIAVNAVLVSRQAAAHTWLLLLAAAAWLIGNLLYAVHPLGGVAIPWWFAFLVLTIAAERLEMTRLMRRHPGAQPALQVILAGVLAGAAASVAWPVAGGIVFGVALAALAAWLGVFDIARRTALAHGLSRYMAACLLGGYLWLGVGGVAWAATALGYPARDAALHALGLGFIISMIMGHAPVILPAVAGVRLQFGGWFYLPLALLHVSLLLRLGAGFTNLELRTAGAALNAAVLALFALTIVGSAIVWRARSGRASSSEST